METTPITLRRSSSDKPPSWLMLAGDVAPAAAGEGVTAFKYPTAFEGGHPICPLPCVDDARASRIPGSGRVDRSGPDPAVAQLDADLPAGATITTTCRTASGTLHALVVEPLPPFAKERNLRSGIGSAKRGRVHGAQLGVGVFVWDPDTENWYRRGLHGRGTYPARRRTYSSHKAAEQRIEELEQAIASGTYQGVI